MAFHPKPGVAKVGRMRGTSPRGCFFTRGTTDRLCIGKDLALVSHSEARAAAAAMSWIVARLWDRMWLDAQVQELL